MSLRQGITAQEEHQLKVLIAQGITWEEICARSQPVDERGQSQHQLLADVALSTVKRAIYDPLVKKFEEAKKAGFKDILTFEADAKKKRDAAAKKAKDDE